MAKFKVGDRVRSIVEYRRGEVGTVSRIADGGAVVELEIGGIGGIRTTFQASSLELIAPDSSPSPCEAPSPLPETLPDGCRASHGTISGYKLYGAKLSDGAYNTASFVVATGDRITGGRFPAEGIDWDSYRALAAQSSHAAEPIAQTDPTWSPAVGEMCEGLLLGSIDIFVRGAYSHSKPTGAAIIGVYTVVASSLRPVKAQEPPTHYMNPRDYETLKREFETPYDPDSLEAKFPESHSTRCGFCHDAIGSHDYVAHYQFGTVHEHCFDQLARREMAKAEEAEQEKRAALYTELRSCVDETSVCELTKNVNHDRRVKRALDNPDPEWVRVALKRAERRKRPKAEPEGSGTPNYPEQIATPGWEEWPS